MNYDALLIVSFGGPEGREDVVPFLQNVLRGKNVQQERLLSVAEHYYRFDGTSPINSRNRQLIAALEEEFEKNGPNLPVYWGNRNWHPLLNETLRQMREDGIRNALAFVTSAYSSYSSCRQYRENIAAARNEVGEDAPQVEKLRSFYNHPLFMEANRDNIQIALYRIPADRRSTTELIFTAHSIPETMAMNCAYEKQLQELSQLIARELNHQEYRLVFQSRSGPPTQPWLGPDICDYLKTAKARGIGDVVIAPIGFVSDHMEIIYDLDTEARQLCEQIGINMVRVPTAGTHPLFPKMVRELIMERISGSSVRPFVGARGPLPDVCADDCCLAFIQSQTHANY